MEQKTMKALVYHEPGKYSLTDVAVPKIIEPTDVIAKVTLAAICTTDIHQVRGEVPNAPYPRIQGHEFCCEVVEVGSAVQNLKSGDRCMAIPGVCCWECDVCKLGFPAVCPNGGVYGCQGELEGCQAEYIRIPWGDNFLFQIPEGLTEEDVILLPDMLVTGWFGNKNAEVGPGKSVAVIGVGPVGQCACMLAKKVFGANQVIAVDTLQYRLDTAINNENADIGILNTNPDEVIQRILEATNGFGVDSVIETVGYKETIAIAITATKIGGIIATVAVIGHPFEIDWNDMVWKNKQIRAGIQQGDGITEMLGMIIEGKIDSKFLLTHRAPLNDILRGYDIFGNHKDGCIKWLITPYER